MVPDPWQILAQTDLTLVRWDIPEPGRYYDSERAVVVRRGLLLVEERAVLWHELVHARRRDRSCGDPYFDDDQERSVDREAARWSMPSRVLLWAARGAHSHGEVADALKTTERMLHIRLDTLHPAERAALRRINREMEWAA
jgi:hypothetical protein